uniref:Uncharacterized protein n=1 Tax=Ditylenchus dipsaci TaxID=166011 RepID=A0A915E3I6_9BILA
MTRLEKLKLNLRALYGIQEDQKHLLEDFPCALSSENIGSRLLLSKNNLDVAYLVSRNKKYNTSSCVIANKPCPSYLPVYYFEVKIVRQARSSEIVIGLSDKTASLIFTGLPGHTSNSFGLHNNGRFYAGCFGATHSDYSRKFKRGDVVGCGINFAKANIFYVLNGEYLGMAYLGDLKTGPALFVKLGLGGNAKVKVNFGDRPFQYENLHKDIQQSKNTIKQEICLVPTFAVLTAQEQDCRAKQCKELYSCVEEELFPLPSCWNPNDCHPNLQIGNDFLSLKFNGSATDESAAASVRTVEAIPNDCEVFYYEVEVLSAGCNGKIAIGLGEKTAHLQDLPGWDFDSFGYHGDDGRGFFGRDTNTTGYIYGDKYTTGDVVGCGLDFNKKELFFTKNGVHQGWAWVQMSTDITYYPMFGMISPGAGVLANFGQLPFNFDIISYHKQSVAGTLVTQRGRKRESTFREISETPKKLYFLDDYQQAYAESTISELPVIAHFTRSQRHSFERAIREASIHPKVVRDSSPIISLETEPEEPVQQRKTPPLEEEHQRFSPFCPSMSTTDHSSRDSQQPSSPTGSSHKVQSAAEIFSVKMEGMESASTRSSPSTSRSWQTHSPSPAQSVDTDKKLDVVKNANDIAKMIEKGQMEMAIEDIERQFPNHLQSHPDLKLMLQLQSFVEKIAIVNDIMITTKPTTEPAPQASAPRMSIKAESRVPESDDEDCMIIECLTTSSQTTRWSAMQETICQLAKDNKTDTRIYKKLENSLKLMANPRSPELSAEFFDQKFRNRLAEYFCSSAICIY